MENIPAIISALGVIITAWFSYNQYTKNKKTDLKIEQFHNQQKKRTKENMEILATIYGELWMTLYSLRADRVYILQPHPASKNLFISITVEVKKKGVSAMKHNIDSVPMSEVPMLAYRLAKEDFVLWNNASIARMIDKRISSIMSISGTLSVSAAKMVNQEKHWIGNVVAEHTQNDCNDCGQCEDVMRDLAKQIQTILPDYETIL